VHGACIWSFREGELGFGTLVVCVPLLPTRRRLMQFCGIRNPQFKVTTARPMTNRFRIGFPMFIAGAGLAAGRGLDAAPCSGLVVFLWADLTCPQLRAQGVAQDPNNARSPTARSLFTIELIIADLFHFNLLPYFKLTRAPTNIFSCRT